MMPKELLLAIAAANPFADTRRRFMVGAVALRQDGVLVRARNGSTNTPEPSVHAEARVLRKAGKRATLYVARIGKNGCLGNARPCARCLSYMVSAEVELVYYTDGTDHTYSAELVPWKV
jgi:tRNA(Arg) A34 adenosine deaminase TadA